MNQDPTQALTQEQLQQLQQYQQMQNQQQHTPPAQQGIYGQQGGIPSRIDPNAIPEYLRNQTGAPVGNEMDAGAGVGGPRLSIKGKQFRFIEGDEERAHPFGMPLNVVILATDPKEGVAKNFYQGAYTEGDDQSPVCYSSDGITPDSGSEIPQCATCAGCPHNKFGTARNQDGTMGKGKACRDFKRLYVVPYDQPFSEVYEVREPPTSFRNMQTYGNQLAKHGLKPYFVVTTLNFAPETSPVLTFAFASYLDQNTVTQLSQRVESGELDTARPSLLKSPASFNGQTALPPGGEAPAGLPQGGMTPPPSDQPPQTAGGMTPPPPPGAGATPPPPPSQPAPCPLGAPTGFKMTDKAAGARYEQFISSNWTDQQLIANGYMVQV
jgi:hypothetical protein